MNSIRYMTKTLGMGVAAATLVALATSAQAQPSPIDPLMETNAGGKAVARAFGISPGAWQRNVLE